jgi:hypothetical protein
MPNMNNIFIDDPGLNYSQSTDLVEPTALVAQVSYDNGNDSTMKKIEMKNEIYPLQKGCAKDIISPMGCNSHVRKGWWLRGGPIVAPI